MNINGYYSLIQLHPDAGRRESINIGVILVVMPDDGKPVMLVRESNAAVARAGEAFPCLRFCGGDIAAWIERRFSDNPWPTLANLFSRDWTGPHDCRFTQLRLVAVRVDDPQSVLDSLCAELVEWKP